MQRRWGNEAKGLVIDHQPYLPCVASRTVRLALQGKGKLHMTMNEYIKRLAGIDAEPVMSVDRFMRPRPVTQLERLAAYDHDHGAHYHGAANADWSRRKVIA